MKRRTKQNVGAWPNMRDDTLKAIADELARARKKHPQVGRHAHLVSCYNSELLQALIFHDLQKGSAAQVYACAVAVAAMAIRVLEEGSLDMIYRRFAYSGNRQDVPKFELTP